MTSEREGLVRGGRLLLLTLFAYLAIVSVGASFWKVREHAPSVDLRRAAPLVLELGLFYAVWRGWRWAKWLLVALCAAAGVTAAAVAQAGVRWLETRMILIGLAVFFGFIAIA